ncbi:MAG TPA: FAD-binding protein [Kiloniellales bacterium]|jgi:FAD/FMN-containing dehydrogenase
MITRRVVLSRLAAAVAALAPWPFARTAGATTHAGGWVNDIHSKLNRTHVARIVHPASMGELRAAVAAAGAEGKAISIAGGRHAMGGQQFGSETYLLDTASLGRVLSFDANRGLIEVEAGIQWPELIAHLQSVTDAPGGRWGIVQKQTGADRLSIGGALSANAHGRGLRLRPIVQDVESFVLVDANGEVRTCSRTENQALFRLAIGGYGLFGVIATVTLRLRRRVKVRRVVEIRAIDGLMDAFDARDAAGFLYGDFQFSTDNGADGFLRQGVFSCYEPVDLDTPIPEAQAELSEADWMSLLYLSHADRAKAFATYTGYYARTSGQVYWSDTHQLSVYLDDYHRVLDQRLGAAAPGSEMITEIYVPRPALGTFMEQVRADFLAHRVEFIYGTIRLIERDDETFLAWAKQPYACIIFNLHVAHTPAGLAKAAADFRRLIDRGIAHGGSYFPTYHRWATREQVLACYPQFPEFLQLKRRHDPTERFQSEWYRHYKTMFAVRL